MLKKRVPRKIVKIDPEPSWDSVDSDTNDSVLNTAIEKAYRWYAHKHDHADSLQFVVTYLKTTSRTTSDIKKLNTADMYTIGRGFGFLCRMLSRGLPNLSLKYEVIFNSKLKYLKTLRKTSMPAAKKVTYVSVQSRILRRSESLIFDVDDLIDSFLDSGYKSKVTFNDFTRIHKIKKPVARLLIPLIQYRVDEIGNVHNEPDIKEAYQYMTAVERNKVVKYLKEILLGCNKIAYPTTKLKRKKT